MTTPYEIDPNPQHGSRGGVWLYCPTCAASFPIVPGTEADCPNADQPDHTDQPIRASRPWPSRQRRHRRTHRGRS